MMVKNCFLNLLRAGGTTGEWLIWRLEAFIEKGRQGLATAK